MRVITLFSFVLMMAASWPGRAQLHSEEVLLSSVEGLFKTPADEIDLARAKLVKPDIHIGAAS